MTSLTRPHPPLLQSNRDSKEAMNPNKPSQLSPLSHTNTSTQVHNQSVHTNIPGFNRNNGPFPFNPTKNRQNFQGQGTGDTCTPTNTPAPAFHPPIAPRLGGAGRPIGRGSFGGVAHAATPGNTPSSLETMGKRIAGRLQGTYTPGSGPGVGDGEKETGGSAIVGGARIAPSYE
jgi:hypothetical protein